jgi:hypothetical protein
MFLVQICLYVCGPLLKRVECIYIYMYMFPSVKFGAHTYIFIAK